MVSAPLVEMWLLTTPTSSQIGRASCRERAEISVVAGSLKKKNWLAVAAEETAVEILVMGTRGRSCWLVFKQLSALEVGQWLEFRGVVLQSLVPGVAACTVKLDWP